MSGKMIVSLTNGERLEISKEIFENRTTKHGFLIFSNKEGQLLMMVAANHIVYFKPEGDIEE